ncbi:MAG: methionine biosynthesis protein MetW [Pseudomonadales bacterium]
MSTSADIIERWIKPNASVLDLGCGDGSLLRLLMRTKSVNGYGLEIDYANITQAIANGVNVIEQNIDEGLDNFADASFDTVIMSQTLQAIHYPHVAMEEVLRIGKEGVITFPNFAHWRCRYYLGTRGKMPVSKFMPYSWYDTPNIHFCTVRDFEALCAEKSIRILDRAFVNMKNQSPWRAKRWPNLFAVNAIFRISK